MSEERFHCPVYEGDITDYYCAEISTGIYLGYFLNDGYPPLMDIKTASIRKARCQACDRCPKHYRRGNIPLKTAMHHLGFPEDFREIEEVLRQINEENGSIYISYRDDVIQLRQLSSGIQLWQEWDFQLDMVHDVQAHFASSNAMYLRSLSPVPGSRRGRMVKGRIEMEAFSRKGAKESLVSNVFVCPNLGIYKEEFFKSDDFIAQVTAFPDSLTCYENEAVYREQRTVALAEQSFVSGLSLNDCGVSGDENTALMTGMVESVRLLTNDLTGRPFYHVELGLLGLTFDLVSSPELFSRKPEPRNVIQGIFRLSARLIEYELNAYNFEIDVSLPLTAGRFEPIRHALLNLQPGEKLYCGIDPPLFDIVFLRAMGEVEGISVEFRLDPQENEAPEEEEADEDKKGGAGQEEVFQILRFFPVSKDMAVRIFVQTTVFLNPPSLDEAKDVTEEYLDKKDESREPEAR